MKTRTTIGLYVAMAGVLATSMFVAEYAGATRTITDLERGKGKEAAHKFAVDLRNSTETPLRKVILAGYRLAANDYTNSENGW